MFEFNEQERRRKLLTADLFLSPASSCKFKQQLSIMASSTIVHAACFAVGAIVGGGIATAVSASNAKRTIPAPTSVEPPKGAIIQTQPTGAPKLYSPGTLVKVDSEVLKHGNPGPISDLLVRRAYVAAYDRRLRHPAWVRSGRAFSSNLCLR